MPTKQHARVMRPHRSSDGLVIVEIRPCAWAPAHQPMEPASKGRPAAAVPKPWSVARVIGSGSGAGETVGVGSGLDDRAIDGEPVDDGHAEAPGLRTRASR